MTKPRVPTDAPMTTDFVQFSDETLMTIDGALQALLEESQSRCALVMDRTGCILSHGGEFHPIDKETMAATAAGVVAALRTMVSNNSSPEISVRLYGSDVDRIHFHLLGDRIMLCMIHGRQIPVGQVRAAARTFVQSVLPVLTTDKSSTSYQRLLKSVQFIESKLDDVFKEPS